MYVSKSFGNKEAGQGLGNISIMHPISIVIKEAEKEIHQRIRVSPILTKSYCLQIFRNAILHPKFCGWLWRF